MPLFGILLCVVAFALNPAPPPELPPHFPVDIPILMYHTSAEHHPGPLAELYVRPSEFERQMLHLIDSGFTFVTFDDWERLHTIQRPVMVTFDDGYPANYYEIFPILQEHGVPIVLFLSCMAIESHGFTEDMIRTMHASGLVFFEGHSQTHADLAAIAGDTACLRREIYENRQNIESLTGRRPIAFAYPAGRFNAAVKDMTAAYFRFGLRHDLGMHNTAYDDFEIRRIRISRSTPFNTFVQLVGA